jgi:hypothetical protein
MASAQVVRSVLYRSREKERLRLRREDAEYHPCTAGAEVGCTLAQRVAAPTLHNLSEHEIQ